MSELQAVIEEAYKIAKSGDWNRILSDWENSPIIARRCSRYQKPSSRWTFLHQAAYFGNLEACRKLISLGASIEARSHDGRSPIEIATERNHNEVAIFIKNTSIGNDSLWNPPVDPDVLPSSDRWREAIIAKAPTDVFVAYGGGLVRIPKGENYFLDSISRVLIGWHGTFNPPRGMDGESMLSPHSRQN